MSRAVLATSDHELRARGLIHRWNLREILMATAYGSGKARARAAAAQPLAAAAMNWSLPYGKPLSK
jgi:hypothetical protein